MILKIPTRKGFDQFEQYVIEDESDSDLFEEPDFSEYMWMENEEEFDETEMQRLEEEELMNDCMDAMLDDELESRLNEWQKAKNDELNAALSSLSIVNCHNLAVNSLLNPFADEFIPRSRNKTL